MKQRIEFIDLAKGICIILVVLLHIVPSVNVPELRFIRIPLYFILSGLFFKDYGSFLNFLKKKTNNILIPFIFFYLISYALFYIIKIYAPYLPVANANGILDVFRQYNLFNGPIWFLLCLFWINIYFCIISHFCRREICKAIVVVTVGVVGAILLRQGVFLPMYLDVAMRALPIFYIGFILKKTPILYPNDYDRYNLSFSAGFFAITIILMLFTHPTIPFESTTLRGGVLGYITSTIGVLAIFMLCKHIKRIPVISYFGRYSIIVLCTHHLTYRPILLCLTKISDNETLISWATFILTMAVTYFIIPVCIRYIPYVTAQKDVFKIQSK